MPSPSREASHAPQIGSLADSQVPPSPRTHRALRRLQSAHNLGAARPTNQSSLISQQRRDLQRNASPTRDSRGTRLHQRGRANSDAAPAVVHTSPATAGTRRSGLSKPVFSHGHLSLQQLFRDGPSDGDFLGALESARWKVIDEGIPSEEDGMVRLAPLHVANTKFFWRHFTFADQTIAVALEDVCLAGFTRGAHHVDGRIPVPDSPRSVASLRQDSQRHFPNIDHRPSLQTARQ